MKSIFLFLTLFLLALQVLAQASPSKPTISQVHGVEELPPGTIKIMVSPLRTNWEDTSCRQEMRQVGVKVLQVIARGSGLIHVLNQGDSLNVRLLKGMTFSEDSLADKDTLLLKEQLCTFEQTYFNLIRKE
ncbi:MAG: hypothetical protein R8G66_20090 [Cytophagales bacterium]|nr:hypothetical protein [Cytophagales bacterium]